MNERIRIFSRLLEDAPLKSGKILDIGCGQGELSELFLDLPAVDEVHGIGLAINSYNIPKRIIEKGLKLTESSVEKMPFSDETFDVVIASHVLEHVPNMQLALKEIRRVMKEGGIFIFFYQYILMKSRVVTLIWDGMLEI